MVNPTRELRECETDELEQRLVDARQELFNLRFQHVTGQLDNSARVGQVRRNVARLHTVLREREIEAAEALEAEEAAGAAGAERQAAPVAARAAGEEEAAGDAGQTDDEVSE
jgi:large subunit ribosomal protein L29